MSKVEKHPSSKDKYQCPNCEYGHSKPKSRQAVYKHYNKVHKIAETPGEEIPIIETNDFYDLPDNHVNPTETETETESETEWSSISWMDPEEQENVTPHTIPDPIKKMAGADGSQLMMAHRTMSKSMIRWSFLGLDRLITWWGKGVTNDPNYELKRSNQDYDVLQNSTITMFDAYGITIPASPILVWSTIVGSAYVPPIIDIQRKADPSKRGIFRAILTRLPFIGKRMRKKTVEEKVEKEIIS